MTVFIGIDPGMASGAVSIISDNNIGGTVIDCSNLELVSVKGGKGGKKEIDFKKLYDHLCPWKYRVTTVIIEQVNSMPQQGIASAFRFGGGYYGIQAVCQCAGLPYILVTPAKWKKYYGLSSDKNQSRTMARRFYPKVKLDLVKDADRAESLLMARYAMYLYGLIK